MTGNYEAREVIAKVGVRDHRKAHALRLGAGCRRRYHTNGAAIVHGTGSSAHGVYTAHPIGSRHPI